MAELIGQGRVDDDDLKVVGIHAAARFAAAGDNRGAGIAQLSDMPRQIFIGVIPRRNNQAFAIGCPPFLIIYDEAFGQAAYVLP